MGEQAGQVFANPGSWRRRAAIAVMLANAPAMAPMFAAPRLALRLVATHFSERRLRAFALAFAAFILAGSSHADVVANVSGAAIYADHCSTCHGSVLRGGGAPPLAGPTFQARWGGRPTAELEKLIRTTMPLNAAGSLTPTEYRVATAFVLAGNGYAPDAAVLKVDPALKPAEAPEPTLPATANLVGKSVGNAPDDGDIAHPSDDDWPTYNRDYLGQRFSALKQITTANVKHLAPACIFQTGDTGSFEASPVVYRGRLYVTTTHSTFAIDAATCKELWRHTYTPPGAEGLPVNRGVALYRGKVLRGTAGGLVFTGTPSGAFWGLDARTGTILYEFNTGGAIGGGISTYAVNGRQYIAVTSGSASKTIWKTAGAPTVIVFALPDSSISGH